ncbi:hypothetical protein BZA77DRAFT_308812 [Pyronema omphalodes]|nr:hypothetical protein BZA77DRAFT_308812 [Pyronema omphalodes]
MDSNFNNTMSQQSPNAGIQSTHAGLQAASTEAHQVAKELPLYKDRVKLLAMMGLTEQNQILMQDLREFIKVECQKRNHPLDKAFSTFSRVLLYRLTRTITDKAQTAFGQAINITEEIIETLIHRICLDAVRNKRQKAKRRALMASTANPPTAATTADPRTPAPSTPVQDETSVPIDPRLSDSTAAAVGSLLHLSQSPIHTASSLQNTSEIYYQLLGEMKVHRMSSLNSWEQAQNLLVSQLHCGEADLLFYKLPETQWSPICVQDEWDRLLSECSNDIIIFKSVGSNDDEWRSEEEGDNVSRMNGVVPSPLPKPKPAVLPRPKRSKAAPSVRRSSSRVIKKTLKVTDNQEVQGRAVEEGKVRSVRKRQRQEAEDLLC